MALLDGARINMGGRDFTVPPLNFAALRRLEADLARVQAIDSVPTPDQVDAVARIVHAALVRNYPEVTEAEVAELIDMGNLTRILRAVMGASGLADEGKAPAAGATANP